MNKILSAKIKSLPKKPGVYLFKDANGRILYIGKAISLKNRVRSHFKNIDSSKGQFLRKTADIDCIETADENQALILEDQLIKKYQPRYNVQRRDDKSYFWVNFIKDEWPRIIITHQANIKKIGNWKLEISSVGPFVNGRELKQVLRAWRKILPYRTCKNAYDKPCLQWHLDLCPAHKTINNKQLTINNKKDNGKLITYRLSLNTLRQLLRLYAGETLRIEAYDISNIHGAHATGSMIVFSGAKPKKSDYRRFRIKAVRGANDMAMLKEILRRRLNHSEWPLPDLMLIDGGRGQLNAANQSLLASRYSLTPIISLAKKEEEIYTIYANKTILLTALPVNLRLTFQAIRNEAHRFAVSYYRKLHGKNFKFRPTPKNLRTKS